jgi:CotS family spore coat protein
MIRKEWTPLDLDEVVAIVAHWGIRPVNVQEVRAVYKITGTMGSVALKPAGQDPDHIRMVNEVCEHLASRGFRKTAPLLPTLNDEPFTAWGDRLFVLTPWREGSEPDYRTPGDIAKCVPTLAAFHEAGEGIKPVESSISSKIGKWPKKLRHKADEIEECVALAQANPDPTEFDKLVIELGPRFAVHTRLAAENLMRTNYTARCEWGKTARPLCHGDASERNFILGDDGVCYLIDLDSVEIDLPEVDLWRLLRRTLRRVSWDLGICREIIGAYSSVSPLERSSLATILSLLEFPEKAAWLMRRYYGMKGDDEGTRSPVRFTRKMVAIKADLRRWERFLVDFVRHYQIDSLRLF